MKYANIISPYGEIKGNQYIGVNIGDYLQFMAIDYIYNKMKINSNDIIRISMKDVKYYKGEKIILPLNWALFDLNYMNDDYIDISEDIIPVFCAMTIESHAYKDSYINEYNVNYLKRYEPIGCRDFKTYNTLKKAGIKAYVNGCLTSVLPKHIITDKNNKVLLVDTPMELFDYIPKKLLNDPISLTQQYYYEQNIPYDVIFKNVNQQYQFIKENAGLVITSRLHVASPCVAMGIPVIFAKKTVDARFSWFNTYIPLYGKNDYPNINWSPKPVDLEVNKKTIIDVICKRISGEKVEEEQYFNIHNMYKENDIEEVSFQKTIHSNFDETTDFLNEKILDKQSVFSYGIWGLGQAAENFYSFMKKNYPNACLVSVLDKYRQSVFHGIMSVHPDDYVRNNNEIMFVLPVQASNIAPDILIKKGFDNSEFLCAGDRFIQINKIGFDKCDSDEGVFFEKNKFFWSEK